MVNMQMYRSKDENNSIMTLFHELSKRVLRRFHTQNNIRHYVLYTKEYTDPELL